uniref:Uncharacterized protein n=1 Tax=Trichuris muris TaxID=70415 RepID=A0A5S6QC87_TRIMR
MRKRQCTLAIVSMNKTICDDNQSYHRADKAGGELAIHGRANEDHEAGANLLTLFSAVSAKGEFKDAKAS